MKILQVKTHPLFDVFLEDGWYNWSRYLLKHGKLIHIGGTKLHDRSILSNIARSLLNESK